MEKEKDFKKTPWVSLMTLEHAYFMSIVKAYLKRNDILKMELLYDKRESDEIDVFWVYDTETECENSKIRFYPL